MRSADVWVMIGVAALLGFAIYAAVAGSSYDSSVELRSRQPRSISAAPRGTRLTPAGAGKKTAAPKSGKSAKLRGRDDDEEPF